MVRVAGLKRRIMTGLAVPTNIGRSPVDALRRHLSRGARSAAASCRRLDIAGATRPRRIRSGDHRVVRAHRRRARGAVGVLRCPGLPGADAARGRSRPSVPLHLRPVAEPRDPHPQRPHGAPGVRAPQGAAHAPALRRGARRAARSSASCVWKSSSPTIWTICSPAWRCSTTTRSASPATRMWRSRRTRARTSSRRSRPSSCAGAVRPAHPSRDHRRHG